MRKKIITLKKGNDVKKVWENCFAFFHFIDKGYLVVKSINRQTRDEVTEPKTEPKTKKKTVKKEENATNN